VLFATAPSKFVVIEPFPAEAFEAKELVERDLVPNVVVEETARVFGLIVKYLICD
jgi:hypothetical protein